MSKPRVDHIGVIVGDLDEAIAMLARVFDWRPDAVKEMAETGLRVAVFEAANVTVELLQYLAPGESFARAVMGGREGLNHITFAVDDIEAAMREMAAAGASAMAGFPRQGAGGRIAFFEPATTSGMLIEICEPDRGSRDRDL